MTTLLLLATALAQADTLRIDGNSTESSFACAGREVLVEGNRLRLTFTGDCGLVRALGNDNTLTVDGLTRVELVGNQNTLTWARNLSGQSKLPALKLGVGNKVKKAAG